MCCGNTPFPPTKFLESVNNFIQRSKAKLMHHTLGETHIFPSCYLFDICPPFITDYYNIHVIHANFYPKLTLNLPTLSHLHAITPTSVTAHYSHLKMPTCDAFLQLLHEMHDRPFIFVMEN